jgi:hypothetical protein
MLQAKIGSMRQALVVVWGIDEWVRLSKAMQGA